MTIEISSHYQTKDLGLVATLLCEGMPEQELVCLDKAKKLFAFRYTRCEKLSQLKDAYYKNTIKVSPSDLLKNIRTLKAKMEGFEENGQ